MTESLGVSERITPILAQEASPGDRPTPADVLITKDLNDQCLYAVDSHNAIYLSGAQTDAGIVHPALLLNLSNPIRSPGYNWQDGTLGIHAAEETTFLGVMRVNEIAHIEWEVCDAYERRGRRYTVVEVTITANGREVLKRRVRETYVSVS